MTAIDPRTSERAETDDDLWASGSVEYDGADSTDDYDDLIDDEFWPAERRWRTPRPSQRGLLIAGCVVTAALALVLVLRPSPAGRIEDGTEAIEPEPQAFEAPSTTAGTVGAVGVDADVGPIEQGISSRVAPSTTTQLSQLSGVSDAFPPIQVQAQGTVRDVASAAEWSTAIAAAQPGDVIRLVANINQPLQYRSVNYQPERASGGDGTAEAPIIITAADGVWIDPNNTSSNKGGLDVLYARHVHVIGVNVRNSQFGIRVLASEGSEGAPLVVANNTVTGSGHSGIHIGADFTNRTPSRHVLVQDNTISELGRTAPEFGEGIYLGHGGTEWIDNTSNVQVVGNNISFTGAEGVDIKPGVRNILVEGNHIHDLSPISGGAISATYVSVTNNPNPEIDANIVIKDNRIWNLNLDGRAGSNDWAIWVGHGGVRVEGNVIWGLRNIESRARAVRVRAPYAFGPHAVEIVDNTFWTATGWLAEGSPDPSGLIQASGNKGPSGAAGVENPIGQPSGAPAVGASGTADTGDGPGSAFD
ncbi:MAG: right-handed parallel beta-helix repeat-containing protein [Actinomycetota bacterium]